MNAAPPAPVIDPDPSTDPLPGPLHPVGGLCLGCTSRRLADPHCVSCARLAAFCHLALKVNDYEHAQNDELHQRSSLRITMAFNLAVLVVVLAMAAMGVRTALAYAGLICVLEVLTFVAVPRVRRQAREATARQRDHVLGMLELRVDEFPEPPPGKVFTFRHEVLLEHVRKKFPAVSMPDRSPQDPARGTDFDVPPLPLRPE
jgi:hypothetical protein